MCGVGGSLRELAVDLTEEDFRTRFAALLDKATPEMAQTGSFHWISAQEPPWFDTGLDLRSGDEVTVIAVGSAYLSRDLDLSVNPNMQLWMRIGEGGEVFRGTRHSHSFPVRHAGRLFLGNYLPGEWTTRTGAISVGSEAYRAMEGGMTVLVLCWDGPALPALRQLAALGDVESLLRSEIDRLENPVPRPTGWDYLWFLGPSEIFSQRSATDEPGRFIACETHRDAAILHKDVSVELRPDTVLRWSWRVETLPCEFAENTLQNHDYLSIAVEFDNGQDLTFLWSSQLPVDTAFRCPIPTWTARETHVVARSGAKDLQHWCTEERNLYTYYQRFVGSIGRRDPQRDVLVVEPPTRVVRVWLIANSMFRRRVGRCEYGAIELHAGGASVVVN